MRPDFGDYFFTKHTRGVRIKQNHIVVFITINHTKILTNQAMVLINHRLFTVKVTVKMYNFLSKKTEQKLKNNIGS